MSASRERIVVAGRSGHNPLFRGTAIHRTLADAQPGDARPLDESLEDGHLRLLHRPADEARA